MALRNQPYIPLYVQDYLTDEKLNMCSATSQGIFIKVMCIMHKSDEYGVILLKQKDKQNQSTCLNFATKLARLLPFDKDEIELALKELVEEKVLHINGDRLYQKRMIHDNKISELRAKSGSVGGKKTQRDFAKAKTQASTEDENENEDINRDKKKSSVKFKIPTKEEFIKYADEKKIPRSIAGDCWYYYDKIGWTVGKDQKPMVNWKSTLSGWWNREKNKL